MKEINTDELKRLAEKAEFFVDRTINGLAVEISDLILEMMEESYITRLSLSCDDPDCSLNALKLSILDDDGEYDVWFTDSGDDEPALLRDEELDFIYAVFQHVLNFAQTWDGKESDLVKMSE